MTKRILVTAAGGPASLSFVRSLRDADPERKKYYIIGTDASKYNIFRSEADVNYLCPRATDMNYIAFINHIIKREHVDFLHAQPEIEVYVIGAHRDEINCRLFLPKQKTIKLLRDKSLSAFVWHASGIKVPASVLLLTRLDLEEAFEEFGRDIWIRDTIGAAGKGSLSRPTYRTALDHIQERDGWGRMMAAEHLTDKTLTWMSIWYRGKMVVAQSRKRLYWAFANRTQSGVTGLTGTGVTISDEELSAIGKRCVRAADDEPHGIFSVDFTLDFDGIPNPTEINVGKFFTTHHFITRAGCNMPEIAVELAFDEYEGEFEIEDPCEQGLLWIRGMDVEPKLVSNEEVIGYERTHVQILEEMKK
jgi:carbamoyl-phosphate synthase large subunit